MRGVAQSQLQILSRSICCLTLEIACATAVQPTPRDPNASYVSLVPTIDPDVVGHDEPVPGLAQVRFGCFQQQMKMAVHENTPVQSSSELLC